MLKDLSNENKGYFFAFIGIILFSITAPATKIALGENNIGLSPAFITFGRSALAGTLAILYLLVTKKKNSRYKIFKSFYFICINLNCWFSNWSFNRTSIFNLSSFSGHFSLSTSSNCYMLHQFILGKKFLIFFGI